MPKKRVFAVDIGTRRVKVVELGWGRSGVHVTRIGMAERTPEEEVSSAVKRAMSDARIRGGECVVGIPRSKIVRRRLTQLPRGLDDAALRDVVQLQAESVLPFDPGEAVFDYFDAQPEGEGISVEVVAARVDEIEAFLAPVREAGGEPIAVVPSTFGLAALAIHHARQTGTSERLLLLSVGYETTDVCLVDGERFLFSRTVPCGLEHFERDANDGIRQFFTELERTLRSFRRDAEDESEPVFEAVSLWGGGADLAFERDDSASVSLSELIESELGRPVRTASPVAGIERADVIEKHPLGWAPFGTALGYALVGIDESWPVNLLPSVERERKEQSERTRRILAYGVVAALLFAGLFVLGDRVRRYQAEKVRALDAEISRYRSGRAAAMKELTQLETMATFLEPRYSQLDILREVTALLPDRRPIAVTSFVVEPSGKITIHFEAQSNDAVSEAITKIGRSAWFTDVRPGQITTVQKENKPIRTFVLTMQLAEDADLLAAKRVGTELEEETGGKEAIAEAPSDAGSEGGPPGRSSSGASQGSSGPRRDGNAPERAVSGGGASGPPPPPTVTSVEVIESGDRKVTIIRAGSDAAATDEGADDADEGDGLAPAPRARPIRIGNALSDQ